MQDKYKHIINALVRPKIYITVHSYILNDTRNFAHTYTAHS